MAIHLGRLLPDASCNQPGQRCGNAPGRATGRSQLKRPMPSLFGLAPGGVYRATSVTRRAVRSYRTLSPLPSSWGLSRFALLETPNATPSRRRFAFCCTVPRVAPAGRYPAPCFRGARTFLHPGARPDRKAHKARQSSGHPANWHTQHGVIFLAVNTLCVSGYCSVQDISVSGSQLLKEVVYVEERTLWNICG